jgi:hypothetical protein
MQYTILLGKNENLHEIEAQEQARFIKSLLESTPAKITVDPEFMSSVDDKAKFRKELEHYRINIIDDADGGLKIYCETDLIGVWKKCTYKMKQDLSQTDPKKRLLIEMQVNLWNAFEG